ncbi:MAG: 5-(carboxyamino)imidazole ribonucleotide synthase [Cyanobacteria bacterium P01_A01_bin.116]
MAANTSEVRRIGVIGGGQLAWMMAAGAKTLGIELCVQTPNTDDPACEIAAKTFLGAVADAAVTANMAKDCDVITFENEFIDLPALRALEARGILFYPQLDCLAPLLDKYDQRQYCEQINLPSPVFTTLHSEEELPTLKEKVATVGLPLALKTRRHGYDGQGTFILQTFEEIQATWKTLGYQPILLEAFVNFEKELAVMVARSNTGEVAVYPVVETQQIDQVCRRVIAPAQVEERVVDEVSAIATRLVTELGFVGILGIELFLTAEGRVLINEIAPRTHNSGHYTLEACVTSQFEQQLRAVSSLPLGSTALTRQGAVMINLLGTEDSNTQYAQQRAALAQRPDTYVYWYGKQQSRLGRKMAHVTVLTDTPNNDIAVANIVKTVEGLWY